MIKPKMKQYTRRQINAGIAKGIGLAAVSMTSAGCGSNGATGTPSSPFARQTPYQLGLDISRHLQIPGVAFHPHQSARLVNLLFINDYEQIKLILHQMVFKILTGSNTNIINTRLLDEYGNAMGRIITESRSELRHRGLSQNEVTFRFNSPIILEPDFQRTGDPTARKSLTLVANTTRVPVSQTLRVIIESNAVWGNRRIALCPSGIASARCVNAEGIEIGIR
jgi:hypothetical protein